MAMRRLRNVFLVGGGVAGGVSLVTLALNDWDFNSIAGVRLGRAICTAAGIVADYKLNVYSRQLPDDPVEVQKIFNEAHKRSADRLLDLCTANRGVFIKVGQHIGALDYLLPPPYIETLKILHSRAPESSLADVFRVIKEDLKIDSTESIFSEFATVPLGAASLAQVYKAKLHTGETVAVKVQHRDVKAHSFVDMKTMEFLVRVAAWIFPDFKLVWLMEETKKNLPMELDFINEGRNADKISKMLQHCKWLKIPKIYWEHSTDRVLIMEYCDGGQINDLEYMNKTGISPKDVSEKVGQLYSEMIFTHGFVHCDPHPGNLLVWKTPANQTEICLLDHGLYTTLSPEFRYSYCQFWLSIINSNVEGIKKYGEELGVGELYGLFACMVTARSWESITSQEGVAQKKLTKEEEVAIRKNVGSYLPQISEILERVPRPMILIFKTNDLIRGIEHSLNTQKTMKSFTTMSKFCVQTVYKEKLRHCASALACAKLQFIKNWSLMKINIVEFILWIRSMMSPLFL